MRDYTFGTAGRRHVWRLVTLALLGAIVWLVGASAGRPPQGDKQKKEQAPPKFKIVKIGAGPLAEFDGWKTANVPAPQGWLVGDTFPADSKEFLLRVA